MDNLTKLTAAGILISGRIRIPDIGRDGAGPDIRYITTIWVGQNAWIHSRLLFNACIRIPAEIYNALKGVALKCIARKSVGAETISLNQIARNRKVVDFDTNRKRVMRLPIGHQ